jgi:epoxyqueuosine reductase
MNKVIHNVCTQEGFNKVAVLSAAYARQVCTETAPFLAQWIAQGQHADMDWLPRSLALRQDPTLLMDNTQTVVVVALNYYQPMPQPEPTLKVARYAWGQDYHKVMKRKLKQALKAIQAQYPEIKSRALVDSAPVMEKALAVGAGFGWQGKHSNVISRDLGSWLFIGILLLDHAFEPDPIHLTPDFCGRCQRCVDACPTQAINPATRSVNSNQCIAYWTIESDAPALPDPIAQNLNGWVFGCDICQEVCPWNQKHQTETTEVSFLDWNIVLTQNTKDILLLTEDEFSIAFSASAAKRTGLNNLQRTITTALN